jgi:uncharacterized damage-inducible protein DinB
VATLFAYNAWANRRLLAAAAPLPAEELCRDLGASFGSVNGTLRHILCGEWRWLRFWRDGSLIPELRAEDFPDLAAIEASWPDLEIQQREFAARLTADRLAGTHTIRGHDYTLGDLIHHLLNHSTYHRGQVALLLRLLGQTPPATDYRLFLTDAPRPAD